MAAGPDKRPGLFKTEPRSAGSYRFVDPELLLGTLRHGFVSAVPLTDPLHRAIAMMFLLTECHPLDDGNGRIARLIANAELSRAGQIRLILTAYRNNYLAALTGASLCAGRGQLLIAVLDYAQRCPAAVDWRSFDSARDDIERCNGFLDPAIAESTGRRLRLPE